MKKMKKINKIMNTELGDIELEIIMIMFSIAGILIGIYI